MKKNMSTADRSIRILVAIVILGLYATGIINGTLAVVLLCVAGIFLLTSFINFCPLYKLLGISSLREGKEAKS